MFCNPKIVKQRAFHRCSLPSVRDLFARFGSRPSDGSFQSLDDPLPLHSSKIESLGYIQEFDEALNREERRRAIAESKKSSDPDKSEGSSS